ncbi:MAG: hypothetical protein JSU77_00760 [Fidelibacterota bacterium]|nr:MAG: hypothetical protein JSU77_00760 [Candidatus Neomarinimicrobiota bacterium]
MNRLPRPWVLILGRLLGFLIYLTMSYRKDVARKNLTRAFPHLSIRQQRTLLRRTYQHFGMVLMDFIRIPALSAKSLDTIVDFDESHVREAREQGTGAVIMTGHLGNWELIVPTLTLLGYPIIPVIVPQRGSGGLIVKTIRGSTGSRYISSRTSSRTMLRLLKEGNFLGLASDQDARKSGVWVTFLGQFSSRPRGSAVFAINTGVPILAGWCILQSNGRYRLNFTPISLKNLPGNRDQAVQNLTQRCMDALEEVVKQYPEQYLWFHRMWKTCPESSTELDEGVD